MKLKILNYSPGDTPQFKRYNTNIGPVTGYPDNTQLWVLQNIVKDHFRVEINGKRYKITRTAMPGLITDKASTPAVRSDWYPSQPFYLWHDVDFSCHYLWRFEECDDDGFRVTNLLFRESIDWKIKHSDVSRVRKIFWHIKKRAWWRSVSTIIGQGKYVNGSGARGNHRRCSRCEIKEI